MATDKTEPPLQKIVFAEVIRGGSEEHGPWLVTLACGHKLATRKQQVSYPCQECASSANKAPRTLDEAMDLWDQTQEDMIGQVSYGPGGTIIASLQVADKPEKP